MDLERDEFSVTYDGSKMSEQDLLATIKELDYPARVVTEESRSEVEPDKTTRPQDHSLFTEALERAKREKKPIVLDFHAEWCLPCKRMERETFPDPHVAALLERYVFLKIDTDRHPELAKDFGVVGLPDFRFLAPDGTEKHRLINYQSPEEFAKVLRDFLDGESQPMKGKR